MADCPCGRPILLGAGTHNRWYEHHCTQYCYIYYQNPDQYPDVKKSESKHHNNQYKRPRITTQCDLCGGDYELINHEKEGNKQFCGNECFRKVLKTKYGHRDWTLLKLLQVNGPLTAADLADKFVSNLTSPTSRQIGLYMKLYVARGVVKHNGEKPYSYSLNTDLPIGKLVVERIRTK
tara:strand:- start:34 stop:567 length:534 start_codon:yes stop_codon:yes gene_type:complete